MIIHSAVLAALLQTELIAHALTVERPCTALENITQHLSHNILLCKINVRGGDKFLYYYDITDVIERVYHVVLLK